MKKIILVLLFVCHSAFAQEAYVIAGRNGERADNVIGSIVPRDELIEVLYLKQRCNLPIANAANLRRADIFNIRSKPDIGCWGKVLSIGGDDFISIGPYGHTSSGTLTAYRKAKILKDGTALIIGPAMTFEEVDKKVKQYHDSMR